MEEEKSRNDCRRAVGALPTSTGHLPLSSVDLSMISLAAAYLRTSQTCRGIYILGVAFN